MIVELNHLRCFVAVAEELHFGRAAARLYMTQPPLSRQIQQLEEILGLVLFDRHSRSVRLTEAGRVYYDDAVRILRLSDRATDSVRRVARGDAGQVTLGFTAVSGYQLIPDLLGAASMELPGIRVVLREMVSTHQIKALETRAIDLGIMRSQFGAADIAFHHLVREPLLLAMHATHPLATAPTINASQLRDQPFVMYSADGGQYFHDRIAGLLNAADVRVNFVQSIDQTHTIVALVRGNLGIAIVPASAQELGMRDVVFRPVWTTDAYADTHLAWSKEPQSTPVERFRTFVIDYFSRRAPIAAGSEAVG